MQLFIPELGKYINYDNEKRYLLGLIAKGGGNAVWAKKQKRLYDSYRMKQLTDPQKYNPYAKEPKGTADWRAMENSYPGITNYVPSPSAPLGTAGVGMNMDTLMGVGAIIAVIALLKR